MREQERQGSRGGRGGRGAGSRGAGEDEEDKRDKENNQCLILRLRSVQVPNSQCPKRKNAPEYFLGLNQGASTITLY